MTMMSRNTRSTQPHSSLELMLTSSVKALFSQERRLQPRNRFQKTSSRLHRLQTVSATTSRRGTSNTPPTVPRVSLRFSPNTSPKTRMLSLVSQMRTYTQAQAGTSASVGRLTMLVLARSLSVGMTRPSMESMTQMRIRTF